MAGGVLAQVRFVGDDRERGRASGASRTPIQENSDHRDRPENAEPRLKNEPIDPTDSTEPTLPTDRIE